LLNSIAGCFRDIVLSRIGVTSLTLGSRDVIGHVTIR